MKEKVGTLNEIEFRVSRARSLNGLNRWGGGGEKGLTSRIISPSVGTLFTRLYVGQRDGSMNNNQW